MWCRYGAANSIATARGISVDSVKHAGIVESAVGKVRILARDELDEEWDPEEDRHLTVWECLQHLVRLHEKIGISHDTAVLLKKLNTQAEPRRFGQGRQQIFEGRTGNHANAHMRPFACTH